MTEEWARATKLDSHEGIRYQSTVEKHLKSGAYRAELVIFYPSGIGGKVVIDNAELEKTLNGGLPFDVNPIKYCGGDCLAGMAIGNIDAILNKHENGEEIPMQQIKPQTTATPAQVRAMKKETDRLINYFTPMGITKLMGGVDTLTNETVRGWKHRGRVSAQWANHLCKNPVIADAGFTRETLRPDVGYWYVD